MGSDGVAERNRVDLVCHTADLVPETPNDISHPVHPVILSNLPTA